MAIRIDPDFPRLMLTLSGKVTSRFCCNTKRGTLADGVLREHEISNRHIGEYDLDGERASEVDHFHNARREVRPCGLEDVGVEIYAAEVGHALGSSNRRIGIQAAILGWFVMCDVASPPCKARP